MVKFLWIFLFFSVFMEARENPFETAVSPQDVGKATQIKDERTDFRSATIKLPSSARILISASVTFQNLDGSISGEIVSIDQNIDWHQPLVLTNQKVDINNTTAKPVDIAKIVTNSKKSTLKELPSTREANTTAESNISGSFFKLGDTLSLYLNQNEITIFTKDTKIRDFLVADPYKVVVDLKKTTAFPTKTTLFEKPPFVSATLGDHDGFYRIAILLDGHYRYDIQAFNGGYIIKLK